MNRESPGRGNLRQHMVNLLQEQGEPETEIPDLAHMLTRLDEWDAPKPTAIETQQLLARLRPLVPAPSPVRRALRGTQPQSSGELGVLLETARAQVSLLRLPFWAASVVITLLGIWAVFVLPPAAHTLVLHALGPLLAALGVAAAFRSAGTGTLEVELACPASPVQLTLARLLVVLGYDAGLTLLLGLWLWIGPGIALAGLAAAWFAPLLLVAGVALMLTLRLPAALAASLAYAGWLGVLLASQISVGWLHSSSALTQPIDTPLVAAIGLVLLVWGTLRSQQTFPSQLPRT